jgi:hypothetical protein
MQRQEFRSGKGIGYTVSAGTLFAEVGCGGRALLTKLDN